MGLDAPAQAKRNCPTGPLFLARLCRRNSSSSSSPSRPAGREGGNAREAEQKRGENGERGGHARTSRTRNALRPGVQPPEAPNETKQTERCHPRARPFPFPADSRIDRPHLGKHIIMYRQGKRVFFPPPLLSGLLSLSFAQERGQATGIPLLKGDMRVRSAQKIPCQDPDFC